MKIKDLNFREFENNFFIIKNKKSFDLVKKLFKDKKYSVPSQANAILVYAFIDRSFGISFEFIAFANFEKVMAYEETYEDLLKIKVRQVYRFDYVQDDFVVQYHSNLNTFKERKEIIDEVYDADQELKVTRSIREIDHLRFLSHPDDIRVYLSKPGGAIEIVWVRLRELKSGVFIAQLLNEPYNEFGVHAGELVIVSLAMHNNEIVGEIDLRYKMN